MNLIPEDRGPEYDSAGFTEADREPEPTYVFSKEQLIQYSAHITERVLDAVKEAIRDTEVDEDMVELSIERYSNSTSIEMDNQSIQDAFINEINNTIELDNDTIEEEMINILNHMDRQG